MASSFDTTTPDTRPEESRSGPLEFPGCTAAEICSFDVLALPRAGRGRHGDDQRPFAHAAQHFEDIAGVHPRETVRRSDDDSRRKMRNVRADSSAGSSSWIRRPNG